MARVHAAATGRSAIPARATGGPVVVVRARGQELPTSPRASWSPTTRARARVRSRASRPGAPPSQGRARRRLHQLHRHAVPASGLRPPRSRASSTTNARHDVALPVARGYPQPLAAAYRVSLGATAERLVKEDRLRPAFLFSECAVARLDDAALQADPLIAALDPDLDSVVNINTAEDYQEARARPAPEVTVQLFGALAKGDGTRGPQSVRAATVDRRRQRGLASTFDRQRHRGAERRPDHLATAPLPW